MAIKTDVPAWLEFPNVIQVFDTETGEEKDYIPEHTCQRIRIGTCYGHPKNGCSECEYGLGDQR